MTVEMGAPEADDAAAMKRAQAGDDLAFEEIIARHSGRLYGLALYLSGQASDAEDILQETLLGAYEALHSFESRSSVKTWLSRILVRQAARHHRSQKVRRKAQPVSLSEESQAMLEGSTAGPTADREAVRMDVMDVLQSLSAEHREIIVLRDLNGLSYQQISEVLGVPAGTVESRIFRARQELKTLLKDYLE
jgi:RNA polymerase sigma-70 factor, ECF subfamily